MKLDYTKIENVEIDGINLHDWPDFCDAYIVNADYNGEPITDKQLDEINEDSMYVYNHVYEQAVDSMADMADQYEEFD